MEMRRMEMAVGAFVVIAIAAFVVLALKVSNLNASVGAGSYTLKARFENIGGLKVRSPVKVGGVVIGRVATITLDTQTMTPVVEMAIAKNFDQLPVDTSAKINTAGLLGEQYVALSIGGDDAVFKDGETIGDTQPALVLEDLISKYLFGEKNNAPASANP